MEEWRFTNKIDELQRVHDQLAADRAGQVGEQVEQYRKGYRHGYEEGKAEIALAAPVADGDERAKVLEEAAKIVESLQCSRDSHNYFLHAARAIRAALTQQKGDAE